MALSKKIQKEVEGLEEKIETLVRTCNIYRGETSELTEELGMARLEVETANKRIDKLEQENAQLKKQLASMMSAPASKKKPLVVPSISGGVLQELDIERNEQETGLDCGKDPQGIFPEEVWRMIFDNLKEPKDLKSCYETCVLFQELLEDKRKIFLFTDVLQIMTANVPNLPRSSTLNACRLVCYGWRQSVDSFVQSEILGFSPEEFQDPSFVPVHFDFNNNPWNNVALQSSNASYNPIPNGYLTYSEPSNGYFDHDRLRNSFRSFLAKFGSYVLALKIGFYSDASSVDYSKDCYNFLCECLSTMPNLVMLYITLPLRKAHDESEEEYGFDFDDEDFSYGCRCCPTRRSKLKRLNAGIGEQPYPNVSSLKIIYFEKCPSLLIHAILTANLQVEKMMIKENLEKCCDIFSLKLGMLQEASLIKSTCFEPSTWKLQKLTLNLDVIDFQEMCGILEDRFSDSLKELNLTVGKEWNTRPYAGYRLILPKLKKLSLRLLGKNKSLDFILPMVSLEELSVDFVGNEIAGNGGVEIIRLRNYISSVNLWYAWRLFPKLKEIKRRERSGPEENSKWKCCTRPRAWTLL